MEKAVQPQHPREGELRGQIEAVVQKGGREFLERQEAQNEGEPVETRRRKMHTSANQEAEDPTDQGNRRTARVTQSTQGQ